MTHRLDFAGSYESLFYLRHLAAGSKEFCKRELLHFGAEDYIPDEWAEYQHQLHLLASRSLIGCAVNLRVLQDTLRSRLGYSESVEASSIEPAMTEPPLGEVLEGTFDLTLRESCNKIVHATDFSLVFQESRTGRPARRYSYWNGQVRAAGTQGKRRWTVLLDVYNWCGQAEAYIQQLAGDLPQ